MYFIYYKVFGKIIQITKYLVYIIYLVKKFSFFALNYKFFEIFSENEKIIYITNNHSVRYEKG